MSDKPINLNRVRKQQARANKARAASENAAKFGRTKAEKTRDAQDAAKLSTHLDKHKRE